MDDGRIGLIDYGSTFRIDDNTRLALANVVVSIKECSGPRGGGTLAVDTYDAATVSRRMRQVSDGRHFVPKRLTKPRIGRFSRQERHR